MATVTSALKVYSDGGARGNPGPAAAAYVIYNSHAEILAQGGKYLGQKTNNEAEYAGILAALSALQSLISHSSEKLVSVVFCSDSELIVNQLSGRYKLKAPGLKTLAQKVHQEILALKFSAEFISIPREQNCLADALVNRVLDQTLSA
jgi:ribonuclease HI